MLLQYLLARVRRELLASERLIDGALWAVLSVRGPKAMHGLHRLSVDKEVALW